MRARGVRKYTNAHTSRHEQSTTPQHKHNKHTPTKHTNTTQRNNRYLVRDYTPQQHAPAAAAAGSAPPAADGDANARRHGPTATATAAEGCDRHAATAGAAHRVRPAAAAAPRKNGRFTSQRAKADISRRSRVRHAMTAPTEAAAPKTMTPLPWRHISCILVIQVCEAWSICVL
jgi:hypothetical protein